MEHLCSQPVLLQKLERLIEAKSLDSICLPSTQTFPHDFERNLDGKEWTNAY